MKRVLAGPRVVAEALRAAPTRLTVVLVANEGRGLEEIVTRAGACGVAVARRPRAEIDGLARGLRHQDVLAISGDFPYVDLEALLERAAGTGHPPLLLLLDSVQDVQNLGSVLRSAVGLGADGVVLCRHGAASVSPAAVRASAGASEHAGVVRVTNLAQTIRELRRRDVLVVGTDATGDVRLDEVDLTGPTALVLGSEGRGMRRLVRESCDLLARIPLASTMGSLNVAVAGALSLYEARRQRGFQR